MADTSRATGYDNVETKLIDLGDGTYCDAVYQVPAVLADDLVLAAATGSDGGLGKIGTVANSEWLYVRCDCSDRPYSSVDWVVNGAQQHDLVFYKARDVEDEVTITVDSLADGETILLQGLTLTAEATANTATYDAREFSVAGDNNADAAALAALINADYSVVTAGTSVAGTDKLIITTDEGIHTIVAAATADYPAGKYGLNATAATELASIVLAINHRDTINVNADTTALSSDTTPTESAQDYALADELASDHNTHTALTTVHKQATAAVDFTAATSEATLVAEANAVRAAMLAHYADTAAHNAADATNLGLVNATTVATNAATARTLITALVAPFQAHIATAQVQPGDKVTVNGIDFIAHADTTTAADHEWAINGANASADADELVTCLNDATYGLTDITAANSSGAIGLTRDTAAATVTVTATPAATSVHSCITIEEAGGVPGVIAAATPGTATKAELSITPVWTAVLTVTESGDRLTVADIDVPGIIASVSSAVVTLKPGMPGAPAGQELATVIQAVSGTAGAHAVVSQAGTLAGLRIDGATTAVSNEADNHLTAGNLHRQDCSGYEYCYLGFMADNATPQAVTIKATRRI